MRPDVASAFRGSHHVGYPLGCAEEADVGLEYTGVAMVVLANDTRCMMAFAASLSPNSAKFRSDAKNAANSIVRMKDSSVLENHGEASRGPRLPLKLEIGSPKPIG
jgi:hypothetical protein